MADRVSKKCRSEIMRRVRSHGNKTTEIQFLKIMRQTKIVGWRRNSGIAGKPDFVFPAARIAIFLDGCFWHGCPNCYKPPKAHWRFWRTKVTRNKARDRLVTKTLKLQGWRVLRIWECALRRQASVLRRLRAALARS